MNDNLFMNVEWPFLPLSSSIKTNCERSKLKYEKKVSTSMRYVAVGNAEVKDRTLFGCTSSGTSTFATAGVDKLIEF